MINAGSTQKVVKKDGNQALSFDVAVQLEDVYINTDVPEVIKQTLSGAVTWQQRNETSLARFLAGPSQFPAFVLALLACGAAVRTGDAEMDLNSYLTVKQSKKATALLLPVEKDCRRMATARVGLTPAGKAIVLVTAVVDLEEDVVKNARLALSGVWQDRKWLSGVADALVGVPLTDAAIQAAAESIENEVDPPSDHLGSADYRRAMAAVLTRQVLEECRQGGENG